VANPLKTCYTSQKSKIMGAKFLPTTRQEMQNLGWEQCDILLVSGDTYIDSPFIGIAVIGRILENLGYKVGIIAQPDTQNDTDIKRLGEPRLFWGVSGGSVDSMVANYTATKRFRKSDDYTPCGINNKRPDRATIAYSNLIRRYFKNTVPIVLGGIEASLRRITHYDYWSNGLRKPILFDSKADILLYGMAENAIKELAIALEAGKDYRNIRGLCYIDKEPKNDYLTLPSHKECLENKERFIDLFDTFYKNNDPITAKGLSQKVDDRFLIQNPPCSYLDENEMDATVTLPYTREVHPYYENIGKVKCQETIKFSITTHHGCWGECNFCAIGIHQGRTIRSRSEGSILKEANSFKEHKDFKGIISDLGGPSANMYGYECEKKLAHGTCTDKRCVDHKGLCSAMKVDHTRSIGLMKQVKNIDGVKKAFVASGIRYDLIVQDQKKGYSYLKELLTHHTSGQMKIAPEHTQDSVLKLMGKPGKKMLLEFKKLFDLINSKLDKKQYLTYYLIAAHPGCSEKDMNVLKAFTSKELKINPEQVQIFTPTPGTYASVMYYTELDPATRQKIFVEKNISKKERQKNLLYTP
jgi:uncharacterized radical SAM protein YgiQ